MNRRRSLCFFLALALTGLAAGPVAADCVDVCTYESSCGMTCYVCVEEHIETICERWQRSNCGNLGVCRDYASATAEPAACAQPAPSFEQFLAAEPIVAPATAAR